MPELPEVETIRIGLEKALTGHKIVGVEIKAPKLFKGSIDWVINQRVTEVARRAKILIVKLEKNYLLCHLKMTGQLIFVPKLSAVRKKLRVESRKLSADDGVVIGGHPDKNYPLELPHKHSHVIIQFDHGTLYFNDLRKFGWLKAVQSEENLLKEVKHLGPEFTWPEFNLEYFTFGLQKRSITIKQLLLDQTFIAGIGNIYADESLFCAKIKPLRKANSLSDEDSSSLYKCIKKVFRLSLKHGGTSSQSYRQVDGTMGTYLTVANVYKREGLPCKVCGNPIERIKISGRSSHYCPSCQK